jgi:zinc protease
VQSQKANIATALDVTKEEMTKFAASGATDKELQDAKTYLTGSFPLALDSNSKIAAALNGFQRDGLAADYVVHRNELIEAVTLDQVNAMAKKYYDPAKLTIVIAGTPGAPAPAAPAAPQAPAPPAP